jgi:dTDP-4-amino-4,6-dideoxygalactose transaminase
VALLGGKVVLADCSERLPLIDPKEVKRKLSKRTRAIIPVHLNGRSCQLEELLQISEESGAVLIEDACKAFASKGPGGYLGTLGAMGCFSLGMVSLISTGYGGAVVTRDGNYDRKLKLIRNHGVPRKGVEQYHTLGFNFRFSDLLAALGIGQLGRLKEKQECVRKVYRRYVEGLSGLEKVQVIGVDVEGGELPLCMEVRSPLRSKIMDYLERHGVEALPFHHPLHSAPYLGSQDSLDHASRFAEEGLILPSGPAQPLENVDRCVELLRKGVALL